VEDLESIFKFQQALQVKIEPKCQSSQLTNDRQTKGVTAGVPGGPVQLEAG
jgi:hypothetical protein